jgi:hypothetical protein
MSKYVNLLLYNNPKTKREVCSFVQTMQEQCLKCKLFYRKLQCTWHWTLLKRWRKGRPLIGLPWSLLWGLCTVMYCHTLRLEWSSVGRWVCHYFTKSSKCFGAGSVEEKETRMPLLLSSNLPLLCHWSILVSDTWVTTVLVCWVYFSNKICFTLKLKVKILSVAKKVLHYVGPHLPTSHLFHPSHLAAWAPDTLACFQFIGQMPGALLVCVWGGFLIMLWFFLLVS